MARPGTFGDMMTIYLYSGTPGTGKSLDAARQVRDVINRRKPRPVIGNFAVNGDVLWHPESYHYVPNWELDPVWLVEFANDYWETSGRRYREDYITLVLDECQLLFNSREWSAKDRLAWLQFFSQHRKAGFRVIFIAQAAKMVDNQFRMLIEYEVMHRKVSSAGIAGRLLAAPFLGRLFVRVTYYYQMGEKLGSGWYLMRRKDAALYNTNAVFERVRPELLQVGNDPSA